MSASPTPSRYIVVGAIIGAVLGSVFALAVVFFADCFGPKCTQERITGVAAHALVGALLGALLGALVLLLHRWIIERRG